MHSIFQMSKFCRCPVLQRKRKYILKAILFKPESLLTPLAAEKEPACHARLQPPEAATFLSNLSHAFTMDVKKPPTLQSTEHSQNQRVSRRHLTHSPCSLSDSTASRLLISFDGSTEHKRVTELLSILLPISVSYLKELLLE